MKLNKRMIAPLLVSSALVIAGCSDSDTPVDTALDDSQEVAQEEANKQLVDIALTGFFVNGDPAYADQYIDENYIQHNPMGQNGVDFVKQIFIDFRPDDFKVEMPFYMADEDFVLQHSRFTGFTNFYERPIIAVDVYRVKDGKMIQHWDVVQQEVYPDETVSGNVMFPIVQIEEDLTEAQEEANADLVIDSMNRLLSGDESVIEELYSENYINHNPGAPNGRDYLRNFLGANDMEGFELEIGFVMADGPYVAVQSRITGFGPVPVIAFDIFRLAGGKIVEHWDVIQDEVPVEETTHGNPMFPII